MNAVKNDKERILKAARVLKQAVTCKGIPIRLSADFSSETTGKKRVEYQSRRLKDENKLSAKDTLSSKVILQIQKRNKTFPDKLWELISTRPALQEKLKEAFLSESKRQKYTKL